MFSFREFLMSGFKNAIGKMADYQVILNASGYFEKGVLLEADIEELSQMIEQKNTPATYEEETETECIDS